jgi:hypothetical protein
MNDKQYNQLKDVVKDKLNNIRKILTSTTDKYDIDESMDKNTLVDMVSDVILEIQDIKEFMDKF